MNNDIYAILYLINADAIFPLYNSDIEDLELVTFLECIVKEGIQLLTQYIKSYPMMCGHKDVIYIYRKNIMICLIIPSEYSTVIGNPYHLYYDQYIFK